MTDVKETAGRYRVTAIGQTDVGLRRDRRQVLRLRMTDGDSGVAREQQQRHRLADNLAAANDDRAGAGDRDLLSIEQCNHA